MLEKCPKCGRLKAQIQARDEFSAIEAAQKGTLSAYCISCGYRWVLSAKDQAVWPSVELED